MTTRTGPTSETRRTGTAPRCPFLRVPGRIPWTTARGSTCERRGVPAPSRRGSLRVPGEGLIPPASALPVRRLLVSGSPVSCEPSGEERAASNGTAPGEKSRLADGCVRCLSNTPSGTDHGAHIETYAEAGCLPYASWPNRRKATLRITRSPCENCSRPIRSSGVARAAGPRAAGLCNPLHDPLSHPPREGVVRVLPCVALPEVC